VSDPTPDELMAAAKRDETLAELAARYVARQTKRTADAVLRDAYSVAMDAGELPKEAVAYRAELASRMYEYLDGRSKRISERERVRAEQNRSKLLGLDRFAGPGRSLDELLEPVREEIRQVGGLTAEHLLSIGRHPEQLKTGHELASPPCHDEREVGPDRRRERRSR
jgi:hypothetical protein